MVHSRKSNDTNGFVVYYECKQKKKFHECLSILKVESNDNWVKINSNWFAGAAEGFPVTNM